MKFTYIISILFLISMSFVLAAPTPPPFQQTESTIGLALESPIITMIKINTPFKFKVHAYNSSSGVSINNTKLTCEIHLYGQKDNGAHIVEAKMTIDTGNSLDMEYQLSSTDLNEAGQYAVLFYCNTTTKGGFLEYNFDVTPSGIDMNNGLYFLIIILSVGFIILGYYVKDAWVVVLGSFGMVLFGLFVLFYGIGGVKDTVYTWGIGVITLMLGAYFGIKGSLETLEGE